jgi:hypothetical protein
MWGHSSHFPHCVVQSVGCPDQHFFVTVWVLGETMAVETIAVKTMAVEMIADFLAVEIIADETIADVLVLVAIHVEELLYFLVSGMTQTVRRDFLTQSSFVSYARFQLVAPLEGLARFVLGLALKNV